uniref:DUF4708 domain-containing protein n=1 Tax=Hydatigena taeniaeformis TaxID=6205 RepID=A0A158RDF2_HYDTA
LASNISVTEFLEVLIAEPQIRHLWVLVQVCLSYQFLKLVLNRLSSSLVHTLFQSDFFVTPIAYESLTTCVASPGKSGSFYRLRICDTELALFKDDDDDSATHVWPWEEVGEPKCRKTEIRMPWLITDERPQLAPILADVLQSTRPENLNEARRRKLSRADSIPSPVVFDAKYHFTITVFVKDINASSKLVYQITCIRAMAFANGTQPAPELESNSFREGNLITVDQASKRKTQKKKGFSLCGLNCMGRKIKDEVDDNLAFCPSQRSADYTQGRPSATEVAPSQILQVVESPSPPQRRRSSSTIKQTTSKEDATATPNCSTQSSTDKNLVTSTPDVLVSNETQESVSNISPPIQNDFSSANLSRCPTYTKSDAARMTSPKGGENADNCTERSQVSPVPSPKRRETSASPSSPAKASATPYSGIPLPRNPTRAMVGTTHHSPSPSGEFMDSEDSGHKLMQRQSISKI